MEANEKTLRITIFLLLIFLTVINTLFAISESFGNTVCLAGSSEFSDCVTVQNSEYGEIFSVKVIWLGVFGIAFLTVLYYLTNSKGNYDKTAHYIYMSLITIGAAFSIYFLSIQSFILKTYCSSCLLIDFGVLAVFFLSYLEFYQMRRR